MERTVYNKLIRDNILNIIKEADGKAESHIADELEFKQKLKEKLFEEIDEFFEDKNEEEMADVFEVLYSLGKIYNIDFDIVEEIRIKKKKTHGGFEQKIILEEVVRPNYIK